MTGKRLNGWKDISSFLGCGVKTAQKLEKENGLPVQRLPPQEGSTAGGSPVFALTDELDRWRAGREAATQQAEGELAGPGQELEAAGPPAGGSRAGPRSRFLVRLVLVVGLILAVYGSVSWYTRLSRDNHRLRSARLEGDTVVGYSGDGRQLWRVELGGSPLVSHQRVILPLRYGDLNGDGVEEVLVARRIAGHGTGEQAALVCLDVSGGVMWRFFPDDVPSLKNAAGRFHLWEYSTAVRLPAAEKGIVVLIQLVDLPSSRLLIVDPRGVLREDYELSGEAYAHAIVDLDRDGADEVLVGGLDTGALEPFLTVLRCGCLDLSGEDVAPGCRETVRCLFGRTEVSQALGLNDAVTGIQNVSEDRLSAEVALLGTPHIPERSYLLDRNLQVLHLTIPQSYKARQRELFQLGKVNHNYSEQDREKMIREFTIATYR